MVAYSEVGISSGEFVAVFNVYRETVVLHLQLLKAKLQKVGMAEAQAIR